MFSLALGALCRERRQAEGLSQPVIAARAAVSPSTVTRFEAGKWPSDPATVEDLVWAYAELTNAPSWGRLWIEAALLQAAWLTAEKPVPSWAVQPFAHRLQHHLQWVQRGRQTGSEDATD